jgi:hypothetical protein
LSVRNRCQIVTIYFDPITGPQPSSAQPIRPSSQPFTRDRSLHTSIDRSLSLGVCTMAHATASSLTREVDAYARLLESPLESAVASAHPPPRSRPLLSADEVLFAAVRLIAAVSPVSSRALLFD